MAIQDKQEGAQDRYIFEEPSSFMQRERTCAKYIGKVSHRKYRFYRKYHFGTNVQTIFFSLIAILFATWKLLIAFKSAKTDLSTSTINILNFNIFNSLLIYLIKSYVTFLYENHENMFENLLTLFVVI